MTTPLVPHTHHDPTGGEPPADLDLADALPHLIVVPWPDALLAQRGYDPRSAYVERFWLGVLGPSATWLLRRLCRGLEAHPQGYRINLADTAKALGLGEGTGRNSMVVRTVDRLCQFGAAQLHGRDRLAVRPHLAPLTTRQLRRLPLAVQQAHDRWVSEPIDDEQRRRAILLAVGLLERGVDPWSIEQHLTGYGFADRLASEALQHALRITVRGEGGQPPPAAA